MDLTKLNDRKHLIQEIKNEENVQRKIVSYKKYRMQSDDFYEYVYEYLESMYGHDVVKEMAVFHEVNLQKRISKEEASIYTHPAKREIENEVMQNVYKDLYADEKLRMTNEAYKYLDQCTIKVVPKNGCFKLQLLLPHQFDVIPDKEDPTKPLAYIISNFDNTTRDRVRRSNDRTGYSQGDTYRDLINQNIADPDDPKLKNERYYVWTKDFNFVMNGKGDLLYKNTEKIIENQSDIEVNVMSPLADYQIMPFIDIAPSRDFEYWVRSGNLLYDGTIKYNCILSTEFATVELQSFSQSYFRAEQSVIPEKLIVGKNRCIKIPVTPGSTVTPEFGFATPSADLTGSRQFRESFLAAFLSSRGLDISVVNGRGDVQKASSGIEKLLQMIEKFEASLDDFSTFKRVEHELYKLLFFYTKALQNVTNSEGFLILKDEYQGTLGDFNPDDFYVEFHRPQAIKTKMQELDEFEKELDLGLNSKVYYVMEKYDINEDEAIEYIQKINDHQRLETNGISQQTPSIEKQDSSSN